MKKLSFYLITLLLVSALGAQTTATFENLELSANSFLDGSDGSGGFSDGHIFLPNTYDFNYAFWSGWAISNTTDTLTAGFTNQYSAITGSGYAGSATYAVTFASPAVSMHLTGEAQGGSLAGLWVTNSTYTYLSMLNGDSFAKKFGGETGDDPDFYLLTIKKYLNGELAPDSINFYLADYRFADNSQDYLIKAWTYVDLSALGNADSLQFSVSSSDVGQFGINTPAYFCVDNITTLDAPSALRNHRPEWSVRVFPNPFAEQVTISWQEAGAALAHLYNVQGQALQQQLLYPGNNRLDLGELPGGSYLLRIETADGWTSKQLIKR